MERREELKEIIRELHAGVSAGKLKKKFAKIIKDTSPEEIAAMESSLIEEGFPPDEIRRLCDVHVQVFEKSLAKGGKPSKSPGHPIHTFMEENRRAKELIKDLAKRAKSLKKSPGEAGAAAFAEGWRTFREIEKHYARKENQLFPALEKKGFTGPTKVMWSKHDEIRAAIKEIESLRERGDWAAVHDKMKALESSVKKMIFLEEKILYPTAARKLGDAEWFAIKRGEAEIGYAWVKPAGEWDEKLAQAYAGIHGAPAAPPGTGGAYGAAEPRAVGSPEAPAGTGSASAAGALRLSEGALTPGQIDLMLKRFPFDVTFVDENDIVRYYTATEHRIFPRSPAIIGRAVQNCHPYKSVHVVNDILKSFREKKKDVAEFWIQSQGAFIHIRYFPLYDAAGAYRGVIEVSQEVTGIRALEGERRILDW